MVKKKYPMSPRATGNHFFSTQMDQIDFLSTILQNVETKYNARELHKMYKHYNTTKNDGPPMTEHIFGRKIKQIDGVTTQTARHGTVYHFNKSVVQKHLDILSQEQLDLELATADKYSRKGKELEERKRKRESVIEEERQRKEEEQKNLQHEQQRLKEEEEDRKLKNIEEQEALCRKLIVEYAHSDSLTRLSIEPSLFRMLESRFADEGKRNEFIKSIAAAAGKPTVEYAGVYVLKLTGLPHTHYVGCSKTVLARIEQHRRGAGAACTAGATSVEMLPLLTLPLKEGDDIDLDAWERAETLTLMYTIGIDKVRGWHYVQRELSDDDRRGIHRNICSRNSLCHRCGFGSHMVTNCFARYRALWMGGGAL